MDRTSYWNDNYYKYWLEKVESAKESGTDNKVPNDTVLENSLLKLHIQEGDKILDFGCGYGRLAELLMTYNFEMSNYTGIDISSQMIKKAIEKTSNINFEVMEGEKLKYNDLSFDKIICWGVFDACFQEQALEEMVRVLNVGGKLLLTGKNVEYCEDDEQALIAEINASKKGHPNYFTNYTEMKKQLKKEGFKILEDSMYAKRGDFTMEKTAINPEKFYEWKLIIEKTQHKLIKFDRFSFEHSKR